MAYRLLSKTFLLPVRSRLAASCLSRCQSTGQSSLQQVPDEAIFSHEHMELRRSLKKIIENDINPHVDEWENAGMFPAHELFKKLGNAGILGVNRPTEYGGLGLDYSFNVAVAEELGNVKCGGIPMAVMAHTTLATPALANFGSDLVKREFLAPAISGDMVACLGASEDVAGSDLRRIQTTAKKDGDDYVINGGKMWTTNGLQADWMCLLTNTSDGFAHICVPLNIPGVHKAKKMEKLGMWCSDTAQIFFEDVRVPQTYLIGVAGMGFAYQMRQFQDELLWISAVGVTALENLIKETVEYTSQRKVFGQSVLDHQTVHFKLAELQTEVELLRSLIYRATGKYIQGNDVTKLASMAKLKAGRLSREVTDSCLQFWGGMGFTAETMVSRFYRDLRVMSIAAGCDEVILQIVANYMGTLPRSKAK